MACASFPALSAAGKEIVIHTYLPARSKAGISLTQFASAPYWLMVLPAAGLLLVFYIQPLLSVLWVGFTETDARAKGLAFGNYELLFTDPAVQRIFWNTARIGCITTVLTVLGGYWVAYAMTRASAREQRWMLGCVLLPFWLSVLVRGFAWLMLLGRNGLLNQALLGAGWIDDPLILMRNETGVMIGMVHYMMPYAVLPLLANMQGIDKRLELAARGLGAGPGQAFRRVFLPLSLPGVVGAGVLVFVLSLGFFIIPALLGGGKVVMIAEYIDVAIQQTLRWGLATMMAGSLLVAVFLVLLIVSRIVDIRQVFGAR
jgi:putative spermidine/putrescine transport system permease protein